MNTIYIYNQINPIIQLSAMVQHQIITNPILFRANICNKILIPLVYSMEEKNAVKPAVIRNLERGIFNWTIRESEQRHVIVKWSNPFFVMLYKDHLRSVCSNMTKTWAASIANNEISSRDFSFMTHQEMRPELWEESLRIKSIRCKNKFNNDMEANTDTLQCRKCLSWKCNFYALQTRSADEPMTLFVTCLDCGCRFRK